MGETYSCLSCGRLNPIRGANYTNKYCNNQCQQNHRRRQLTERRISEWLDGCGLYVWKEVPDYIREYLISTRGHKCQSCGGTNWMNGKMPLVATQRDGDPYNNKQENLELTCHNCLAQK